MRDAHGRIGRVDVLAAGARRTVGVDAAVALVDLDVDRVVDDRIDPDRRERGVTARIAVIGRDADEAVHARFGLQPAIGIVTLDEERRGLDARFFAVMDFQELHLVARTLGPAGIHAQKHVRPVLAFRAAGAGMHFEIGVVAVGLAGQHGLDLLAGSLRCERPSASSASLTIAASPSSSPSSMSSILSLSCCSMAFDAIDALIQLLALAHQLLGFLGVVPEVGILCLVVQPVQSSYRLIPVKDASSAGLWPA
jgi:hypothetical protein